MQHAIASITVDIVLKNTARRINSLLRSILNVETLDDFHDGEWPVRFEVTHSDIDNAVVTLGGYNEDIVLNEANGIDLTISYVEGQDEFFLEGEQFETSGAEDVWLLVVSIDDPIFIYLNKAADKFCTILAVDLIFKEELQLLVALLFANHEFSS